MTSRLDVQKKILKISFVVVILDQASKLAVKHFHLFPVFFNKTVAFSLPIPWYLPWIFIVAGLIILSLFFPVYFRSLISELQLSTEGDNKMIWGLAFVLSGAVSNLIDRALYNGRVVDFIDFKIWPVFNLADTAIVCGVLLIIYSMYNSDIRRR